MNIFFHEKPNLKKIFVFFLCVCVWGGGGEAQRRPMDRQTSPNQFAPFNFFKVGGITMH